MAIQRSHPTTDTKKRISTLKSQLYGFKLDLDTTSPGSSRLTSSQEATSVGRDLIKIFVFASLAIAIQIALKFILKL